MITAFLFLEPMLIIFFSQIPVVVIEFAVTNARIKVATELRQSGGHRTDSSPILRQSPTVPIFFMTSLPPDAFAFHEV